MRDKGGWIKLHRQLIANGWLKNKNVCVFWLYCLLKATHETIKVIIGFQEVNLEPGQFIFGRKKAAEETGLSEQEIRTCVAFLKNAENLTIKSTNKYSIITVNNWHTYQGADKANQPTNQPASNQQLTTYKKDKNEKKGIYSQNSLEVLFYLNNKTGRHYRDASHIEARLRDGGSVEDCKAIIDKKLKDKHFIENPKYLNPETLFRKSHWDKYLNEPSEAKPTW